MKKTIKLISALLLVAMITALVIGCGQSGSTAEPASTGPEAAPSTSAEATTTEEAASGALPPKGEIGGKLVIWGGMPPENGPQDLVDAFMKKYPGTEVEYIRYVNDDQGNVKLDTALMSGEQIDVYQTFFEDKYIMRAQNGVAEDLGPYLERDNFDVTKEYDGTLWNWEGRIYALPGNYDFQYVIANETMLREAGLTLPETWTWDEYAEFMKKLTKTDASGKVYGGFFNWQDAGKHLLARQNVGPDVLYKNDGESNFDLPIYKTSMEFFNKLFNEDKSHPSFAEIDSSKMMPHNDLIAGKVATAVTASWTFQNFKNLKDFPRNFRITATMIPTLPDGKNYAFPGHTSMYTMNPKSANKDTAFEYIKYAGTEGQRYLIRSGKVPSWNKFTKEEVMPLLFNIPDADKYFDIPAFEKVLFSQNTKYEAFANTRFKAMPQMEQIWKEEVANYISGASGIDTALKNAKERADKELSTN